ncbi:hypothetical protein ALC57_13770 [Trachymyrmex cornetzi]|uniref:Uncharacterized protein n=1 Tax=Trachymyrmex cornetzi TaxID=471704 RepID=A0A151IZI6_9HYME|nr:hypothetical protein ALC57_13770 [Trachymyrmex cornetzi]
MAAFPYPRHIPSKPVAKIVDGNKVEGNSDIARYEVQINHKGLCPSLYALMPSLSIHRPQ